MQLLSEVNGTDKMAVVILCIAAIVFLLVDVILVMSLHKHNNRLAAMEEKHEIAAIENAPEVKLLPAPENLTKEQSENSNSQSEENNL